MYTQYVNILTSGLYPVLLMACIWSLSTFIRHWHWIQYVFSCLFLLGHITSHPQLTRNPSWVTIFGRYIAHFWWVHAMVIRYRQTPRFTNNLFSVILVSTIHIYVRSTVVYLIILPELWPPVQFVWATVYLQFWYKYIQ